MAFDPLTAIAGPESSYGTNLFNPTSSATGIFQDLTSQSGLSAIGGNPSQYPTAASAPASVQFAVNAYLYNTQGFTPWTIGDPTLAAQIQADGGTSAFAAQGSLSTNPAEYAALDQPGALAGYFQTNGTSLAGAGGSGLTVTPVSATTAPGADGGVTAGTAGGASPLDRPFEWTYQQLITGVIGQVNTSINQVETMANGPLSAMLALAVIVLGISTLMGRMPIAEFKSRILRMAFVIALVAPGNTLYQNWVEGAVLGLPAYFANSLNQSSAVQSAASAPAQMFDAVYNVTWADALHIWHETPWSLKALFVAVALVIVAAVIVGALISMFFVFAAITFLTLVMMCVGPIFILALLFRELDRFLRGFVDVIVTLLIMLLIIDIVLGFFMTIMINLMGTFAPGSSPNTDLPGFAGMAIVLVIMGYSMTHLARLVERVGGGVTIALDSAGYWMRGQALADAARLASRTAGLLGRG